MLRRGLLDENGNIVEEYSYDAWGRRRNPTDWSYAGISEPTLIDRGFTGHEHLDMFGLINMNGRIYDPITGRFLSPDNYVQAPGYSQSYNRYAYCFNNPLRYTDPDGEWVHILAGAIAGSVIGSGIGIYNSVKDGDGAWVTIRDSFIAGHVGGAAGAAAAATGGAVGGGANAATTTAINGGSGQEIMSANFWGSNIGGLFGAAGYGVMAGVGGMGNARLFNAPNGIKEPLSATLNRYGVTGFTEGVSNFFSQNVSTISGSAGVLAANSTFSNGGAGFRPADLGATNFDAQIKAVISYSLYMDKYMPLDEMFDYSNALNNFQKPSRGMMGDIKYVSHKIPGVRIAIPRHDRTSSIFWSVSFSFLPPPTETFSPEVHCSRR